MELIISGRGVILTPTLKGQLGRKVVKLGRLLPRIMDARVTCTAQKFRHTVRLVLRARRRTFSSVATADHLIAAIDDAVEAMQRQVRDEKERRRGARARSSRRIA